MKKTFAIGFLGLFLVGGFMTGLYLVNQQTNPASKAASEEIVAPIAPPAASENKATLVECQKVFGKTKTDADFKSECDLNSDGVINILDLSKLK